MYPDCPDDVLFQAVRACGGDVDTAMDATMKALSVREPTAEELAAQEAARLEAAREAEAVRAKAEAEKAATETEAFKKLRTLCPDATDEDLKEMVRRFGGDELKACRHEEVEQAARARKAEEQAKPVDLKVATTRETDEGHYLAVDIAGSKCSAFYKTIGLPPYNHFCCKALLNQTGVLKSPLLFSVGRTETLDAATIKVSTSVDVICEALAARLAAAPTDVKLTIDGRPLDTSKTLADNGGGRRLSGGNGAEVRLRERVRRDLRSDDAEVHAAGFACARERP